MFMSDPKPSPQEIYDKREEFGLENSVEMLTEIIESEKDYATRKEAVKFLGGIGNFNPFSSEFSGEFFIPAVFFG